MSSRRVREVKQAAMAFCEEVEVETTKGNHLCITLFGPTGLSRKVFTGNTPGDHREMKNLKTQLRQQAAIAGCVAPSVH